MVRLCLTTEISPVAPQGDRCPCCVVVHIPCRGAEADSHGPDCSSDHRDSTVLLQGVRCPGCAGGARSQVPGQLIKRYRAGGRVHRDTAP